MSHPPSASHSSRDYIMRGLSQWVVRCMPADDIITQKLLKDHDVELLMATFPLSNPIKSSTLTHETQECPKKQLYDSDKQWPVRIFQVTTDWFLIWSSNLHIILHHQNLFYSNIIPIFIYIWLDITHLKTNFPLTWFSYSTKAHFSASPYSKTPRKLWIITVHFPTSHFSQQASSFLGLFLSQSLCTCCFLCLECSPPDLGLINSPPVKSQLQHHLLRETFPDCMV